MQPYLFPYIGYFQLVRSVDKFVFYDDVNYIRQGWINRNNLLVGGKANRFSVPLKDASSFRRIDQTEIDKKTYAFWLLKFWKTIALNYQHAPYFAPVMELVKRVMDPAPDVISQLASGSVRAVYSYLGLSMDFVNSSDAYDNTELKGTERLIEICKMNNAAVYNNPPGGKKLYQKEEFAGHGILLNFIHSRPMTYRQFSDTHVPWLSIIDVLMFNSVAETNRLLDEYDMV